MQHTTRESRLAAALLEAADTLTDGFDTAAHLRRVCDRGAELLAARAVGIMLIDDDGRTVTLAGSGRLAPALLESQRTGGPCPDSHRTGRPVPPRFLRDPEVAARWPQFTACALRHGITAAFAVPLRRHGEPLGALTALYPNQPPGEGSSGPVATAQSLADAAALGLDNHRAHDGFRTRSEQLQHALTSRVRIEQAKGILAERQSLDIDEAFEILRTYARRNRLPLDAVARSVVEQTLDDAELGIHPETRPPLGPPHTWRDTCGDDG
ncbi:GAF and ANTAR domain-containing protein [Streptomyces roseirectus]|uniref:GAF and ANTAR domain-containing protein n=1 Tax=Streptomyces roseirectus TaxID=2768066 RepID=A0A7H0II87_9ACTN|nr:GAF and ANTAR domain-containing protein [Streptomyces roseirectus]QNP72503.1 GAF and ANTAR domain-containing protein [Streptomyces roseirectus]